MNQKHYDITSVLETAIWNPDHLPSTPNTHTLTGALTVPHLATITAKLVHSHFCPRLGTSFLDSVCTVTWMVTEGSLVGAQE